MGLTSALDEAGRSLAVLILAGGRGDDRGAPRVGRVTHWKVCTKAGDAVAWAVAASFGSVCILGAF